MKSLVVVPVFNEEDILPWVIDHLQKQGCDVYVLDNWSTDYSADIARTYQTGYERWPAEPTKSYEWTEMLRRVEEIARDFGQGRWCMVCDADEIRRAPAQFGETNLAVAFARVTAEGYNAVQFHAITFQPIDNGYQGDPERYFQHYLHAHIDARTPHVKAWFQGAERVDLHTHGGHQALFSGRKLYPVPFVLKHYPIRSQAHGERKVFRDRLPRFLQSERAKSWHVQYDRYRGTGDFLGNPADLERVRRDCTIVTLSRFPDIFEAFAASVERWEPLRRRIVVTSGGLKVSRPGWTVIEGIEPFVYARNLNIGLAAVSEGDVLASNDDVVLTEPIIDHLQAIYESEPLAGVIAPQCNGGIGNPDCKVRTTRAPGYRETDKIIPFVCVLLRREILDRIPRLDEGFVNPDGFSGYGGDDELYGLQVQAAGFHLLVSNSVQITHGHGVHKYSSSFLRVMTEADRTRSLFAMRARVQIVKGSL